jgi:hypothetical protein
VHALENILLAERGRHGPRSQKPSLRADHDFVARQLPKCHANRALRPLMPVIDGGIEEVDAILSGSQEGIGVRLVGSVIDGAEISPDAQAGDPKAAHRSVEARVAECRVSSGVAFRSLGGCHHALKATLKWQAYAVSHSRVLLPEMREARVRPAGLRRLHRGHLPRLRHAPRTGRRPGNRVTALTEPRPRGSVSIKDIGVTIR